MIKGRLYRAALLLFCSFNEWGLLHFLITQEDKFVFRILVPNEEQEDLEVENAPDGMDGEQTWPTQDELQEAEQQNGDFSLYVSVQPFLFC